MPGARTRRSALESLEEGSTLQPISRCSTTPIDARVTETVLHGHFPHRTRAIEKPAIAGFSIAGAGFDPATFGFMRVGSRVLGNYRFAGIS